MDKSVIIGNMEKRGWVPVGPDDDWQVYWASTQTCRQARHNDAIISSNSCTNYAPRRPYFLKLLPLLGIFSLWTQATAWTISKSSTTSQTTTSWRGRTPWWRTSRGTEGTWNGKEILWLRKVAKVLIANTRIQVGFVTNALHENAKIYQTPRIALSVRP